MRWAVRRVNQIKIRRGEIGVQVILTDIRIPPTRSGSLDERNTT